MQPSAVSRTDWWWSAPPSSSHSVGVRFTEAQRGRGIGPFGVDANLSFLAASARPIGFRGTHRLQINKGQVRSPCAPLSVCFCQRTQLCPIARTGSEADRLALCGALISRVRRLALSGRSVACVPCLGLGGPSVACSGGSALGGLLVTLIRGLALSALLGSRGAGLGWHVPYSTAVDIACRRRCSSGSFLMPLPAVRLSCGTRSCNWAEHPHRSYHTVCTPFEDPRASGTNAS